MTVLSVVLQSLLALYYIFSGVAKIAGAAYWVDIFRSLNLPQRFRVVTGVVQLIGAASLIVGYWVAGAVAWAGVWLGITMVLACLAHLRVKDPIGKTAPAIVFTALIVLLTVIRADGFIIPLF